MATLDSTTALKQCSSKSECVHPEAQDGYLPATLDYFYRDVRYDDLRLRPLCRRCYSAKVLAHRNQHPEKKLEWSRRYNANNRERLREYHREWNQRNKEKVALQHRIWRANNREREKARIAKISLARKAAWQRNRRARVAAAEGTHTAEDIQLLLKRQKGRCYYCGVKVGDNYHPDHVVPLAREGRNDISNLVIACPTCNLRKFDKLPHEWGEGGRLL